MATNWNEVQYSRGHYSAGPIHIGDGTDYYLHAVFDNSFSRLQVSHTPAWYSENLNEFNLSEVEFTQEGDIKSAGLRNRRNEQFRDDQHRRKALKIFDTFRKHFFELGDIFPQESDRITRIMDSVQRNLRR